MAAIRDTKLNNAWSRATWSSSIFHPTQPILATPGEEDKVIRIWEINYGLLLNNMLDIGSDRGPLITQLVNNVNSELGIAEQNLSLDYHNYKKQDSKFVFVSFSHEDKNFVLKFASNLQNRGVSVWVYLWNNSIPGTDLDEAIDNAIRDCTHFLIVLSPASLNSKEVQSELRLAHKMKKHIVPIRCQHCEPPRLLLGKIYADLTSCGPDDDDHLNQVLKALEV